MPPGLKAVDNTSVPRTSNLRPECAPPTLVRYYRPKITTTTDFVGSGATLRDKNNSENLINRKEIPVPPVLGTNDMSFIQIKILAKTVNRDFPSNFLVREMIKVISLETGLTIMSFWQNARLLPMEAEARSVCPYIPISLLVEGLRGGTERAQHPPIEIEDTETKWNMDFADFHHPPLGARIMEAVSINSSQSDLDETNTDQLVKGNFYENNLCPISEHTDTHTNDTPSDEIEARLGTHIDWDTTHLGEEDRTSLQSSFPTGDDITISVSRTNACIRIIARRDRGTVIHYITPFSVWPFFKPKGLPIEHLEPVPLAENLRPLIYKILVPGVLFSLHVETRLRISRLFHSARVGQEIFLSPNSNTDRVKGTIQRSPDICRCGNNEFHFSTWRVNIHSKAIKLVCERKNPYFTHIPLRDRDAAYFLSDSLGQNPKLEKRKVSDGATAHCSGLAEPPAPKKPQICLRSSIPAARIRHSEGLIILQWNSDTRLKNTYVDLFALASRIEADIICIQEAQNCSWIPNSIESRYGYKIHSRDVDQNGNAGKVITLVHTTVEQHITDTWGSNDHDTVYISMNTNDGTLLIANAYLQTNLDNGTIAERDRATAAHMEINSFSLDHDQALVVMDANETRNLKGRARVMENRPPGSHKSVTFSGSTRGSSTMDCYDENFVEAHRQANVDLYAPLLHESTYTYKDTKSADGTTIMSKIDYTLISKNLRQNLTSCTNSSEPANWGGKQLKNFHKVIITKLKIGLNTTPNVGKEDKHLKGSSLDLGPDFSKLDSDKSVQISRMVEHDLAARWRDIGNHYNGNAHDKTKLKHLSDILRKVIIDNSRKILGSERRPRDDKKAEENTDALNKAYIRLKKRIGCLLGREIYHDPDHPKPTDYNDVLIEEDATTFFVNQVTPSTKDEWDKWWKSPRKQSDIGKHINILLNDSVTSKDPKALYRTFCKPHTYSTFKSITRTTGTGSQKVVTTYSGDEQIEDELTNLVSTICEEGQMGTYVPERRTTDYTTNKHMANLLTEPSTEEIEDCIKDLSSSTATDGINARIIKVITTVTWPKTEEKTILDLRLEKDNMIFSHTLKDRANELGIDAPPLEEWTSPSTKKITQVVPFRAKRLIKWIVTLSFKTKDLPTRDKLSIITGIPKKGSQIRDIDKIRPISVGPIIGRIINKVLATRLAYRLSTNEILDPAQHAFLHGKNIHEAINSILTGLRHYKENKNSDCYMILYDISKAYDSLNWWSIERALERLGVDPDFIDFVMNSHKGSHLAMRTNIKGNITPKVEMKKAIKQGCPLAPLLFIIVMDELHKGYRKFTGYNMGPKHVIHSRGYCDDTSIMSSDIADLEAMNAWTHEFFSLHGLKINVDKTYLTGRKADGRPLEKSIKWPGSGKDLNLIGPHETAPYLGLKLCFDLVWDDHRKKMNGVVMNAVSRLRNKNLSLYQGACLVKHMMGPMLEIGMRHTDIPLTVYEEWDRLISQALLSSVFLSSARIHQHALLTTIQAISLADLKKILTVMQTMESLTKPSELNSFYEQRWKVADSCMGQDKGKRPTKNTCTNSQERHSHMCSTAYFLTTNNLRIKRNMKSTTNEVPININSSKQGNRNKYHAQDFTKDACTVTALDTLVAWLDTDTKERPQWVDICTDGSTYPGRNSGAALMLMEDDFINNDIWQTKGAYWTLSISDNYLAELSAINKALRTIPINQGAIIWTDSQSSIDVIHSRGKNLGNSLRQQGRPYVRAIMRVLAIRDKVGTFTRIKHVNSHTGARDMQSIGNAEADRWAKWVCFDGEKLSVDIDLMENELPFIVYKLKHTDEGIEETPIHCDIRKELSKLYKNSYILTWSARISHGQLIRDHPSEVVNLIKEIWGNPTTPKLKFLLECLNNTGKKELNSNNEWKHSICTRCTRGAADTIFHRQLSCPAIADLLNRADTKNWALMDKDMDIYREGTTPLEKTVQNCYNNLTKKWSTIIGAQCYNYDNAWYITTPGQIRHLLRQIISTNWRTISTVLVKEKDDDDKQKTDHFRRCPLVSGWRATEAMIKNLQKTQLSTHQICNIAQWALKNQAATSAREEWQTCKDIYDTIFSHLHTEKIRNSGPLDDSHETGTILQDDCTFVWVNPTTKVHTETYTSEALSAVRNHKTATRYVMLTDVDMPQRPQEGLRLLATIPPHSITLKYRTPLDPTIMPQRMSHVNEVTYYIYVFENKQASTRQINMDSLCISLQNVAKSISLTTHNPEVLNPTKYQGLILNHRNTQQTRPSLFWYRDQQIFRPHLGNDLKYTSLTDERSLLAGALGLNLKQIKSKLLTIGHTDADITSDKVDKIQTNLRNTALEIYREYQNWMNRDPPDT